MNSAYRDYLTGMADRLATSPAEHLTLMRFIDRLEHTQATDTATPIEPDTYAYATAAGLHVIGLLDEGLLAAHCVDPAKIPADTMPDLLEQWAEETNELMCDGETLDIALDRALDAYKDQLPETITPDDED